MKPKRRWLLLLVPLALFVWAYRAASWRPKLIGVQSGVAAGSGNLIQSELLISPDGKLLASGALMRRNGVPSRGLMVWQTASRRLMWRNEPVSLGWMKPLAFSPDSRLLAVISDWDAFGQPNRVIDVLDATNGELKRRIVSLDDREIQSAAFASNRALVAATSQGAAIVDVQTGKPIRQWKFRAVAFVGGKRVYAPQSDISADGQTILALANGRDVTLYDAATGQKTRTFSLDKARRNPRLSPDGTLWALEDGDMQERNWVYDAQTGRQLWGAFVGNQSNFSWAWSADSQGLVLPKRGGYSLFKAREGTFLRYIPAASGKVALAPDPTGDYLYTLDDSGKIWRWRLR